MKIIFIDTETTGLPQNRSFAGDARIVQLSWIVVENKQIVGECDCIIYPDFEIKNSHIHGITTERAKAIGIPIKVALDALLEDSDSCDLFVSYNSAFDKLMIDSELSRIKVKHKIMDNKYWKCAMLAAATPINKYKSKWHKLPDLYRTYFNEHLEKQHNALSDSYACLRCYFWTTEKLDMKNEISLAKKELKFAMQIFD